MKKRTFFGIFAFFFTLVFSTSFAYGEAGSTWYPISPNSDSQNFHAIAFTDRLPLSFNFSVLQGQKSANRITCTSTQDSKCLELDNFFYTSILKVCEKPNDTDCVDSLGVSNENQNTTKAVFQKYTVKNHLNAFPSDSKYGIPEGSMPSIWTVPGLDVPAGTAFAVIAGVEGNVHIDTTDKTWDKNYLQASIVPVVLHDFGKGNRSQSGGWSGKPLDGIFYDYCGVLENNQETNIDCGHVNGDECLLPTNEQGLCYIKSEINIPSKFNLKLRLSHEPNGWLHGRLTDPNVSISKIQSNSSLLSVTAGFTTIPMAYQGGNWSDLPKDLQDFWLKCMTTETCGLTENRNSPGVYDYWQIGQTAEGQSKLNLFVYPNSFGNLALTSMSAMAPLIGDKAQKMTTSWSYRSLTQDEMNGADRCFTELNGIKGIVSTNSTTYTAGPPTLKNGELQYKVASTHFLPDGISPFKGTYNLVIRGDTARCIYRFTSAPIRASISVVSSDGSADVATTVTSEKNGWFYLSANNFQFSAPVIKVKFSQDKISTKNVVVCQKGTLKTLLSGANQKCPVGFKKKN